MDDKKELEYLNFSKINTEIRDFYKDLSFITNLNEKKRKLLFDEERRYLYLLINRIYEFEEEHFIFKQTPIHYAQFGLFFENLLKFCALTKCWDSTTRKYTDNKGFYFEDLKTITLEFLKDKLSGEELTHIKETLDFIQIQRNNFAHAGLKSYDHYAVPREIYLCAIVLNTEFNVELNLAPFLAQIREIDASAITLPALQFKKTSLERYLTNKKLSNQLKYFKEKDRKRYLVRQYSSLSPWEFVTEEIHGYAYPEELDLPKIEYIQLAEPHVLISDIYNKPKKWYYLRELLKPLADQAFVTYYGGAYQASFLASFACIELAIKYELIRRHAETGVMPDTLEQNNLSFGALLKKAEELNQIGLAEYTNDLQFLNKTRKLLQHYNAKSLDEINNFISERLNSGEENSDAVVLELGGDENTEQELMEEDLDVPTENYEKWSILAAFAYKLMNNITNDLYGEKKRIGFLKEGLDDYDSKSKNEAKE